MALKSKKQETNLPEEFETSQTEEISFDDLEFEAEFINEDEKKEVVYYTITGKVQRYEPSWETYGIQDLNIGDEFEGYPELRIIEKDDKSYNAVQLKLMDDGEILNLYFNYPKKDYPYVKGINKGFDFYRNCFDFIFSILRWRDETNVIDKNGEEVNNFRKVNIETFIKFVDTKERVGIKITEGNPDSEYNSWIIYKME
jgi:hypothetical protein